MSVNPMPERSVKITAFSPESLLQRAMIIRREYEVMRRKTGRNFNIFDIAGIADKEIIICRVLCDLLSPDGSHAQGIVYLKLFMESVLHRDIVESELLQAHVYREYVIKENRRIDIVIQTPHDFIPIEVKINAADRETQCEAYYQEAKHHTEKPTLYYLTKHGNMPDEKSMGFLKNSNAIKPISFAVDILTWLKDCVCQSETIRLAPIREILLQWIDVIQRMTNQTEESQKMELMQILMQSPESIKSALAVQESLELAKETLLKRLFIEIDRKVGRKRLHNLWDYAALDDKKIETFYQYKTKYTHPGISYLFQSNVKDNVDIWVRLEVGDTIYTGYCCTQKDEAYDAKNFTDEEIQSILHVKSNRDSCWLYWEYCPNNILESTPGFKSMDDVWCSLFDPQKFDDFTSVCASQILRLLEL